MVADIEELEEMDASEIHAERLNAKEVLKPNSSETFILPVPDGTVKLSGGDQVLRTPTVIRDRPDRGEKQRILQRESDEFLPTHINNHLFVIVELKMTQHWMDVAEAGCKASSEKIIGKNGEDTGISSALDEYDEKDHQDVSSWLTRPAFLRYYPHPGYDQE